MCPTGAAASAAVPFFRQRSAFSGSGVTGSVNPVFMKYGLVNSGLLR